MGMFDNIYVKAKLPLTEELERLVQDWSLIDFQTKDLENCLSSYQINEDGRLVTFNDAWWEENSAFRAAETVRHHGTITFYHLIQDVQTYDWWVEFIAFFSYGQLDKIELLLVEKTPVERRQLREKAWKDRLVAEKKTIKSQTRKLLRKIPGYSPTVRGIGEFTRWLGSKIFHISTNWS
jgi:hypothetical protein